jgi:hypothetical protein
MDVFGVDYLMLADSAVCPCGIYRSYHLCPFCLSQFTLIIEFIYLFIYGLFSNYSSSSLWTVYLATIPVAHSLSKTINQLTL